MVIPGTPVPTTGNIVAVPVEDLFYLDMSIDAALELIISLGMTSPDQLQTRAAGGSLEGETAPRTIS